MKLWWLDVLDADGDAVGEDVGVAARVDGGAASTTAAAPTFDEARALIAMACADGAPGERERACVARLAGGASVDRADVGWRVYRPREAGVPDGALAARRVLERMAQVALSDRDDGIVDDSEAALLSTYARAYGVDDDTVARILADQRLRARGPWLARWRAALAALAPGRRRSSASSSSSSFVATVVTPREVR